MASAANPSSASAVAVAPMTEDMKLKFKGSFNKHAFNIGVDGTPLDATQPSANNQHDKSDEEVASLIDLCHNWNHPDDDQRKVYRKSYKGNGYRDAARYDARQSTLASGITV